MAKRSPAKPVAAAKSVPAAPKRGNIEARARVAEIAYGLWEKRGCRDGNALEDWLEAEKIVAGKYGGK